MKVYESLIFAHAIRSGKVLFSNEEVQILESAIRDDAAEIARLREVERLAKAYRAAVMERRAHKGVDPNTDDSPLGTKWGRRMEDLTTAKRAAGEELFAALDKEAE